MGGIRDRGSRRVLPARRSSCNIEHRDIVTTAAMNKVLKGLHQNVCKASDEGIILKRLESSTRLSLQKFQRTLDVAGE